MFYAEAYLKQKKDLAAALAKIAELEGRLEKVNRIVSTFRVTDHSIDVEWVELRRVLGEINEGGE